MGVRTLAAEVAFLDVLLGVVPRAPGVGRGDGQHTARNQRTCQHARDCRNAKEEADKQRSSNDENARRNHLPERRLGGNRDTFLVIWFGRALHDARNLPELPSHFRNHVKRSFADRFHRHCREEKGQHRSHKESSEDHRVEQIDRVQHVHVGLEQVGAGEECGEKRKGGEDRGTDGEALADRGSGVARRIEDVSTVADMLAHAGHLGDAACVVGDRAIRINRKADDQCTQHPNGCDRNPVHACKGEGHIDAHRNRKD